MQFEEWIQRFSTTLAQLWPSETARAVELIAAASFRKTPHRDPDECARAVYSDWSHLDDVAPTPAPM